MALILNTQIAGQEATNIVTYGYLYESLNVVILEDDLTATKLYIDLIPFSTSNGVPINTLEKFAEFDINPGLSITVDLMGIVQQHKNANVFKFADADDMAEVNGVHAICTEYRYDFNIYTDKTLTPILVKKYPLIGGRDFGQFTPAVGQTTPLNEFQYYGLNSTELENRWSQVYFPIASLSTPTAGGNVLPTVTIKAPLGDVPCGGFLIWKSRFGGWMFWGFDLQIKSYSNSYEGNLDISMFESTQETGGKPYVPVDYTGISSSYSLSLKALSLTIDELKAVAGINSSPAIYYQEPGSRKVELMRLTSATVPLSSLAAGGDFSVSLQSISKTKQKVI